MSPLFRKSEEKAALEAAALTEMRAEIGRLKRLSVHDLAVELLPGFGPDGADKGRPLRVVKLGMWLFRDFPRRIEPARELMVPVREGLECLERAELVYSRGTVDSMLWRITPLGDTALAEGTIEQYVNRVVG
jgi:hypothetical protein